jgi:hypothetical protein
MTTDAMPSVHVTGAPRRRMAFSAAAGPRPDERRSRGEPLGYSSLLFSQSTQSSVIPFTLLVRCGTSQLSEPATGVTAGARAQRSGRLQQHDAAIRAEASPIKGGSDFLATYRWNANGNKLSSVVAGVARSNLSQGPALPTKSYARSKAYAKSASPNSPPS